MNTRPLLHVLALGVLTTGCSVGAAPGEADTADAEASAVTAVVVVERTVGYAGEGSARSEAVARFVRVRGAAADDDALRMVGAAVDFPALGTCTRLPVAHVAPAVVPAVELVDVGTLTLEADGVKKTLVARRVPDVADLVSGVVYTARAAEGEPAFPSRGRYLVRGGGGAGDLDVAPFTVDARVEGEPADVRVADQDAVAGSAVSVPAGALIDLAWDAGASGDDYVYVDVAPRGSAATARCLFADNGRASLSPALFASDDGSLTLHRLHREPLRAKGIDGGEARFDFAVVVGYHRH